MLVMRSLNLPLCSHFLEPKMFLTHWYMQIHTDHPPVRSVWTMPQVSFHATTVLHVPMQRKSECCLSYVTKREYKIK